MKCLKLIKLIVLLSAVNLATAAEVKNKVDNATVWSIKNVYGNDPAKSTPDDLAFMREVLRQIDTGIRNIIGLDIKRLNLWRDYILAVDQKAPAIEIIELNPMLEDTFKKVEQGTSDAGMLLRIFDNDPEASSDDVKKVVKALIKRIDRSNNQANIEAAFTSRLRQIQTWRQALGL